MVGLHVPNCELFAGRSRYRERASRPWLAPYEPPAHRVGGSSNSVKSGPVSPTADGEDTPYFRRCAYAQDMSEFLNESELTERRAFIESFAVTKIPVSLPDSPVVGAPPFASAPGAMTVLADAARTLAYTLLPAGLQLNSPSVQHLGKSVRAQDVAYTYTQH